MKPWLCLYFKKFRSLILVLNHTSKLGKRAEVINEAE